MDLKLEELVVLECVQRGIKIAAAESCTGGLLADTITNVPGSSKVFGFGIVAYSIDAKVSLLKVPRSTIEQYGVVSLQTAESMAAGALSISNADLAVAITGYAGPKDEQAGLVYICVASIGEKGIGKFNFIGDRKGIKEQAVEQALLMVLESVKKKDTSA